MLLASFTTSAMELKKVDSHLKAPIQVHNKGQLGECPGESMNQQTTSVSNELALVTQCQNLARRAHGELTLFLKHVMIGSLHDSFATTGNSLAEALIEKKNRYTNSDDQ